MEKFKGSIDISNVITSSRCMYCGHLDRSRMYTSNPAKYKCVALDRLVHLNDFCWAEITEEQTDQTAKSDAGKPQLTLVPRKIIFDIARVREYGNNKYGDPDNWKTVEKERYRDAAFRHFMAYLDDPTGVDSESGLPHLSHLACNIAFLCEMEDL